MTFDAVPHIAGSTFGGRRAFWEAAKRMQSGSLAMLCWHQPEGQLRIEVVEIIDHAGLGASPPSVGFKCAQLLIANIECLEVAPLHL